MNAPTPSSHAGQAVYTRHNLARYDTLVLRASNRWIWRCPTSRLRADYDRHVAAAHLDVGVGTGYFLDHCHFPVPRPRLTLFDLNAEALAHAAARVARHEPRTERVDVLAPIAVETEPFGSIAMNYLLHCLPGPMTYKARAFDHLIPYLAPGGVLFGATILSAGVRRSAAARRLMALYNARGIFDNVGDSLVGLRDELEARFDDVRMIVTGCVARFAVRQHSGHERPQAPTGRSA
ncbi:class I SAM-dependent methyltransferase [Salinisphaera sp. LB1]|uniref:class I SAM-dependent methyltransferase n=1 Tax=Salinisphaera sp. LB1 TaxID=2183911 RepID=UPI000D705077|nr:class I SAM-dependent methyltransferase [Salinisphaera sp. LB1]AWN15498.1 Putative SAM-dependent methyltransferase [Salinisphaera sp. LB1]